MRIDAHDIPPAITPAAGAQPDLRLLEEQGSFAETLGRAARYATAESETPEAQARTAAQRLVATAFIAPLLAQVRNTSQAAPPFAPTQGEKQFRALTDSKLAHDIVRAVDLPIVERITADMLRRTSALRNSEEQAESTRAVEGVA